MPTKRKWFDLKTTKGWIEAAGALVAVLGGAIGFYLQVFPKEPDKPDEPHGRNRLQCTHQCPR